MYESFLPSLPDDYTPSTARATGGNGNPLEQALAAEGVTGQLADVARSIYQQESGSGANTKTSNAGARGGMQVIPTTFASVADKGWDINDPVHNARSGVRYLKQLDQQSGGNPALTAAGYYGGPGGMEKARKGIAVSDPRNPKAPNTLQYGQQVAARLKTGGIGRPSVTQESVEPYPVEQSDTPYYTPVTRHAGLMPPPPPEQGVLASMGTAVMQGAKSTARSIGAALNNLTGDLSGVEDNRLAQIAASEQDPAAKTTLLAEIAARKKANPNAGVLQAVGDVGSAALNNPLGTAQFVAEQAPNAVVSLGGGLAGGKAGALAGGMAGALLGPAGAAIGGTIGGTVGFLAGMFLGNSLLEIGGKSIEKAEDGFTPGEASEAVREGAIKGGVVTAVDAATLGAGRLVSRTLSSAAVKAGARAEAKVLSAAGVDVTSGEKIVTALADPALRAAATKAGQDAAKAASTLGNRTTQAGTIMTVETGGEGVGEYYGELAATGKADIYDAATEALAGFAQSAPETFLAMTKADKVASSPQAIRSAAIEQQRQAGLAPVIAAKAKGGVLSTAAMAAQDSPEVAAEYAAQQQQNFPQVAPVVDPAARLAELESIGKGGPEFTNPITGVKSQSNQGRLFTPEEHDEYQQLKKLQAATETAAGTTAQPVQADPLAERIKAIAEQARASGMLTSLRGEQSPIDAKQFVNDLAIAQSPSTRPDLREQALARLEYASAWAESNPVAAVTSGIEQNVGEATPGVRAETPSAPAVATLAPVNQQATELLRRTDLTDVDRQALTIGLAASTNPSLPEATRHAARTAVNEVIGRNMAPVATAPLAAGARMPSLFAPAKTPSGSAEEVLAKARQNEDSASQLEAMGYPEEAAAHADQADLLRMEAEVRQTATEAPAPAPAASATAAPATTEPATVAAPKVSAPAGEGSAQLRKRRAVLAKVIADGLGTVERRNDGQFFLVDGTRKRQFKLEGPADAQLARKAVADAIHASANQANTAPTEAQAEAGNYKKGRVDFDGLKLGIENPVGSTRSGKSPDGKAWSVTMSSHYGDLTGTTGADGDGVDVYLAPNARAGSPAFIVDQYNSDGSFDEHKVVLGVATEAEATAIYDAHFSDGSGPSRRQAITAMPVADLKTWSQSPAAKQPAGKTNGPTGSNPEQAPAAGQAAAAPDIAAGVAAGGSATVVGDAGRSSADSRGPGAAVPGAQAADGNGTPAGYVTVQVAGKPYQVELVNELAANDASTARGNGPRTIGKTNAATLQKLASALGKKIQIFRDATLGDGFVDPATPGTIYLNERSSINPLAVFGHEFLHQLRQSMPAVHASLMKVVKAKLKKDGAHKFRNDYYKADAGPNANGALNDAELEEITSDIGGNLMSDVGFWSDVFKQVASDSPAASKSLIARLAAQIYRQIDKLIEGIKQGGFGSTNLVNDLKAVRAAFKDALAQYVVQNNLSQAGMQAEMLKAAQAGKREEAVQSANVKQSTPRAEPRSPETGIHFSQRQRTEIDGRQYGTGMKGQEAKRLQGTDDKRLLDRAYTYIDEGNGVKPESGVGSIAHEVKLPKLYDARVNADKLWNAGDLNATESAILDAGYHGYYVSPGQDGSQQGTAVVLGRASRNLQAKPLADWKNGASSAPAAPLTPAQESRGLMSKELSSIDAANIPGAKLRNGTLTVPLESRDAANDEMVRIGSSVRFSNARDITATPAFENWYGAWQNAAGGQDEKATNAGGAAAGPAADRRGLDVGGGRDVDAIQQRARLDQDPAPATTVGQAYFSGTSGPLGKDGSPLVVYHGTRDDIESFDLAHPNRKDVGWLGRGIYTSSSADQAGDYAEVKRGAGGERILPLYLSVKHPYVISNAQKARMKGASQAQIDRFTDSLKGLGYDGVVMPIEDADNHVELVAFEPGQVKSAVGNNGNFDATNSDITQSTKRAPRDPAIGDKTDVAKLPQGKPIPQSAAIGSLEDSLALARSKSYAKGRELKVDIQDRVLAAEKAAKVDLSAKTQESFKFLSALVVKDARLALESNENAIGWYDKTVSRAIGALATVHPEIETDPKSRLAFLWALATTSNGLKVGINFKIAEEVYRGWKETGVMPSDAGIGNAKAAIDKGLELYNTLSAKMGHERLFKFMATEFEVGQIGRMLGEAPGGEWMPTPVLGSAVLGPKIGNGFFSNLNGYFSALTMDRWLMRTWGRMTGTLLEVLPAKIAESRTKLANTVASLNDSERKLMAKLIGVPMRRTMTRAELDALSVAVAKTTMKPENREIMNATPATTRLRKDGNGLAKTLDGQKEAPGGPAERNWIRAVFTEALAELNTGGKSMTMSDLQALLWYPERRLYDAAKSDEDVANGYEDDEAPDYANAAEQLALRNGVQPEVIKAAMARAEQRGTVKGRSLTESEKAAMIKEFHAPPEQAVQLAFEVAPDPADADLIEQWGKLSLKDRTAITKKVKDAVLGEVVDAVGATVGKTVGATGGYAGLVNPNLLTEYKHTQMPIEQARALASAIGLALDQDSVALVDPRAEYGAGLLRINFNGKVDKHAAAIFDALHAAIPEVDAFTARGNNFDVLNFTDMTNEALHDKMQDVLADLSIPLEGTISFGDIKSELVEKAEYENHITGLRSGAGQDILARVERARDRAREIVAQEIRSASDRGVQPGARKGTGRTAAARLDADIQQSLPRGEGGDGQSQALDSRPQPGTQGTSLEGLPAEVQVDGQLIRFGGFKPAQDAAVAYTKAAGIAYNPPKTYTKVDPARAKRIADAFEAMPHDPQDPTVKAAYQAMIDETAAQYAAMLATGIEVEFIDFAKTGDPYGNPRNAILDVTRNNHLWIFPTEEGFGGTESADVDISGTPMLQPTRF
jgi:hypothetical protein